MKIAITGANGYVGQELCNYLLAEGHTIVPITRKPYMISGLESQVIKGTKEEKAIKTEAALNGCQVLVHLAAKAHTEDTHDNSLLDTYRESNVDNTLLTAQAVINAGAKRFIFLSSIKVNGNKTSLEPYKYSDIPNPEDAYGQSKWEAECALIDLFHGTDTELLIIRPPLIYGLKAKGNIAALERLISLRLPLPFASINNKRSMISLTNLCEFIGHCLSHPKAANETFLVSDGEDLSTVQFIQLLGKRLHKKPLIVHCPKIVLIALSKLLGQSKKLEKLIGNLVVDIEHTKTQLGWSPPNTRKPSINDREIS
jgi:UDP-glucose 4-epimerase